jgi:hypothetical protein
MGSLAPAGQPSAMTKSAVTAQVHQSFDVHADFPAAVTFDHKLFVYNLSDDRDIIVGQIITAQGMGNICLIQDFPGRSAANPVDIGQGNHHMLAFRQVYASYTCQGFPPCSLGYKINPAAVYAF